jgi:hypothetical protein
MKKSILNLYGVKELTTKEKKLINAGRPRDWDKCCLKEDSPAEIPFGCESYILCFGDPSYL